MEDLAPITINGQIPESTQESRQPASIAAGGARRSARQTQEIRGSAASRFTQRLVRSQPGTREHDDELRAAELVDMYFQEMQRYSRTRNEPIGREITSI